MHGFSFDIESDGLYLQSSKIWYMRLTSFEDGRSLSIKPFEIGKEKAKSEFISWLNSFEDGCIVSFHNGLGFDLWALWKLLGIVPRVGKEGKDWLNGKHVQYVDTYVLSMYLNPDLPKHSLEYLASGSEDEKMDYRGALVAEGVMKEYGLTPIIVSHVRKSANAVKLDKEGKPMKEAPLTEDDAQGSSFLVKASGQTIALERNKQSDDITTRNTTTINILKNRDFGETGPTGAMYYNFQDASLYDLDDWLQKNSGMGY